MFLNLFVCKVSAFFANDKILTYIFFCATLILIIINQLQDKCCILCSMFGLAYLCITVDIDRTLNFQFSCLILKFSLLVRIAKATV